MNLKDELAGLLGANVPLLNLVTYEEDRVVQALEELKGDLGIYAWDLADGFHRVRDGKVPLPKKDVNTSETLLPFLADHAPPGYVFVLRDFHHAWNQKKAYVTRKLRNMVPDLRAKSQYLIFVTPSLDLPLELKDDVVVLHVPLPDREELGRLFEEVTSGLDQRSLPRPEVRQKLISSALGLTTNQARLAFSRVWARYRRFDDQGIEMVTWAKQQVIRESGALEFWPAEAGEADVGGLDLMKEYLRNREQALTDEAQAAKVPRPRGVALVGIPGTGKSLSAKMLSGLWKMPLLRFDVGAVYGSLLGESEKNTRFAIQLAETVSPCILWIDEMEKAFAGVSAGSLTGGAGSRVFGTFITWMQEHRSPVFVIATANDIGALPVELMGRFNRIFFLDLPTSAERRDILAIHLKRMGVLFPERSLNLGELVEKTQGFVGREIERVVGEAKFLAFADGNREIEQADLLKCIAEVIPVSKSHAGVIEQLRAWKTDGRAFPASREEARGAGQKGRTIEV